MRKKKMKKEKEQCRRKEVADSCYASGWHENGRTRSRTVVRKNEKKKIGKERKNGGERKSQTPVMPRNGMRIEEPGRGPWLGSDKLCRHNFKHNTMDGASSIMPA